jgi:hypothetical protein
MRSRGMAGKVFKHAPEPIPVLTGKAAREFEKQIRKPPTEKQKQLMKEADEAYRLIKRK